MYTFWRIIIWLFSINFAGGYSDLIYKAEPVSEQQFPFYAQIYIGQFISGFQIFGVSCGGTLIEPKWILTAAHCFTTNRSHINHMIKIGGIAVYMDIVKAHNYPINSKRRFGYMKRNAPEMRYICKVYFHPQYFIEYTAFDKLKVKNDLALLRLERPFSVGRAIKIIKLPKPDEGLNICRKGTIISNGMTFTNDYWGGNIMFTEVHSQLASELKFNACPRFVKNTVFYTLIRWSGGGAMITNNGGPFVCYHQEREPVQCGVMSANINYHPFILTEYESISKHMWFIKRHVPNVKIYYKPLPKIQCKRYDEHFSNVSNIIKLTNSSCLYHCAT